MSNDSAADTYGWDTVFAVRIADVNKLIGGKRVPYYDEATDPLSSVEYSITGEFGSWSVTTGGSGSLLNLLLPITALTLVDSNGDAYAFTKNGQAVVQVSLEFVLAGSAADGNGTLQNLQLTTSSTSGSPAATLQSVSFDDDGFANYEPVVKPALQSWIDKNLDKFATVFATVNLDRTADQGQFAFLYPTAVSYAYIDYGTLDTSILAVLCMTGGRSPAGLQSQVSPNAIPAGARAGFLISQDRFLSDVIAPSLPYAFPGLPQSFDIADGTLTLPGAYLPPVASDGSNYPVLLGSGSVTLTDTEVTITTETSTLISETFGIYALCTSGATYAIELYDQSSGAQTLGFTTVSSYAHHSTQTTAKTEVTEEIAKVILTVAGLVLGFLTDGIVAVIGGALIGILSGVIATEPDKIAAAGTNDAPSIDSLLQNSTALVVWPNAGFKLTSAALNGSLQLGGMVD